MFGQVLRKVFGSKNDRELKRMGKLVAQINGFEPAISALDDVALRGKTDEFKQRLAQGATLDDLLPEAFAVVREAGKRALGMRHFDVQMIGGITLHEGRIAEMRTGEGKTLMATLPVYLNALTGKGVFVITVNDYLAQRDAEWMGPIYRFLGMEFGVILSGQEPAAKRAAYAADITYGTNNEFGFDYLRDNMAFAKEDRFQRGLYFSIVDEVDSILIDESRTPLIISGAAEDSSELYRRINQLVPILEKGTVDETGPVPISTGHYTIDEKMRQLEITEEGHLLIEEWLVQNGLLQEGDSLYSAGNLNLLHHVHSAVRAHSLFHRDVEYIVQDEQVVLIDEHTGRTMPGRPAWAMISASWRWNLAFSTLCGIPDFFRRSDSSSEVSIDAVPTSTGAPFSVIALMSSTIASYFSAFVRYTRSFRSCRSVGLLVGMTTTSRP
jgi:preprotein translocase subunit SecA